MKIRNKKRKRKRKRKEKTIDKQILNEIIIQRVLYPLINEAFKLLGEGGVPSGRPGDVDIIFVKGKKCYITLYLFLFFCCLLLSSSLSLSLFISYFHICLQEYFSLCFIIFLFSKFHFYPLSFLRL